MLCLYVCVAGLADMYNYYQLNQREGAARLAYLVTLSGAVNPLLAEAEAKRLAMHGIQLLVLGVGSGVTLPELTPLEVCSGRGGGGGACGGLDFKSGPY